MKRTAPFAIACTLVISLAVLPGCANESRQSGSTPAPEPTSEPTETAKELKAVLELMGDWWASFDTFNEGIQSGKSIPVSLQLYRADGTGGYLFDEKTIVSTWNTLCALKVDTSAPAESGTNKEEGEESISFVFDSGKEGVAFDFVSTSLFVYRDELCPVSNPEEVQALLDALGPLIKESNAQNNGRLLADGTYLWDANGNGSLERLSVTLNNNGDEAPSTLTLSTYGNDIEAEGSIDRAYGITSLTAKEDDQGPYLQISYEQGDYYSHDHIAECTVRLDADKLLVEYQ